MPHPNKPKILHPNVPGEEVMLVHVFQGDEQREISGLIMEGDYTIADLREKFGGNEGEITSFVTGRKHPLSLQLWDNLDPDTTKLKFVFRFTPASGYENI